MPGPHGSLQERWEAKVERTEGCWLWQGAKTKQGYGQIGSGGAAGRVLYAHRVAYELFVGPIPEGKTLDHTCEQPSCVRWDHLVPMERGQNAAFGWMSKTARACGHGWDDVVKSGNGTRCGPCRREQARAAYERKKEQVA